MTRFKTAVDQAVPNSGGTAPPQTPVPVHAADCHIHVYDSRFAPVVSRVTNATVSDYRLLQKRLGLSRVVIVQPRNYGVDNSPTLDAIDQLGIDNARGVGVLRPDVSEADLDRLHAGGIRGLRFTVGDPATAIVSVDMIDPIARRIERLGWHIQLNMPKGVILANAALLGRLPVQIVFDHLAHVPSTDDESWRVVMGLVQAGKAWVKISGAYMNSDIGPPDYPEATRMAQACVNAAPEPSTEGTDWPHPSPKIKPDDAALFDLLTVWAPAEAVRHRILVQNPETLYGFPKSSE